MPNMRHGLNISQQQKTTISTQLQHAIKLLQMSSVEIVQEIEKKLNENPFLEKVDETENNQKKKKRNEEKVKPLELEHERKVTSGDRSEEIESYFEDSSDYGYYKPKKKTSYDSRNIDTSQIIEGSVSRERTLYEDLVDQLRLMNISDIEFLIGDTIISHLDGDGYLRTKDHSLEDIAKSVSENSNIKVSTNDVKNVLVNIVQKMDPPGVGGRDLQEVLLIQISQKDEPHYIAREILLNDKILNLLQHRKIKEIVTKLNSKGVKDEKGNRLDIMIDVEAVNKEIEFINNLEPYPARNYESSENKYIVPDVVVRKIDESFAIKMNESYIPRVGINKKYKKILSKNRKDIDKNTKEYLDKQYSDAQSLITSIKKRRSTIVKVVENIVERQKEFFEKGVKYLKPLTLKDIAEEVELHESTISRVTTEKYMDTPWGIYPFKFFFSSSIKSLKGEKSSTSIKEMIKEIIESEPNALTDTKIVEILANKGIKIARRTVAKYRKALKIMPSYYRKNQQ